jgi:hypothetical protein
MSLPYENASSGSRALEDIQKVLTCFGCSKFGTMTDTENAEILVQFVYRGRQVQVKANAKGYAAAWLKENPYSDRMRVTRIEYERRALVQGQISIYSILRDWIKGQITAIECGMLTFEGAFLGQILLPTGRTVLETAQINNLLPAPQDEKVVNLNER